MFTVDAVVVTAVGTANDMTIDNVIDDTIITLLSLLSIWHLFVVVSCVGAMIIRCYQCYLFCNGSPNASAINDTTICCCQLCSCCQFCSVGTVVIRCYQCCWYCNDSSGFVVVSSVMISWCLCCWCCDSSSDVTAVCNAQQ